MSTTTSGNRDALGFQNATDQVLNVGGGTCFDLPVSASDWFETAGFFANLLRRSASHETNALGRLLDQLQVKRPLTSRAVPGGRIERLQTRDREQITAGVWQMMDRSAKNLKTAVEESGISRQAWCARGGKMPAPIAGLFTELPERGRTRYVRKTKPRRGPRSRSEVLRMVRRLERTLLCEPQ